MAIVATGLLLASMAQAQDIAVRTAAPVSIPDAHVTELARTPEVLILLSPDVFASEDWDIGMRHLKYRQRESPEGILRVDLTGPFRSVQEVRAALHKSPFDALSVVPPGAISFMTGVAASLESVP